MKTLLMGLAMPASLAAAAWSEVWRFDPGVGVGPIKLNGDYLSPTKLGLTPGQGFPTNLGYYLKYKEGVETDCTGKKITQIIVLSNSFSTKSGPVEVQFPGNLKVGSSVQQMQTALGGNYLSHDIPTAKGAPKRVEYVYTAQGLMVLAEGGKILQFNVFMKR